MAKKKKSELELSIDSALKVAEWRRANKWEARRLKYADELLELGSEMEPRQRFYSAQDGFDGVQFEIAHVDVQIEEPVLGAMLVTIHLWLRALAPNHYNVYLSFDQPDFERRVSSSGNIYWKAHPSVHLYIWDQEEGIRPYNNKES